MAQILRTVALRDRSLPAAGETAQIDLPVNPISALVCTLKYTNATAAPPSYSAWEAAFAKLSNINIRYRGATLVDGKALDLAVMYSILSGIAPWPGQVSDANGYVRSITFPIIFGRRWADPAQCFPATRRGDLVLEWTADSDPTGSANYTLSVETVEILDAQPASFFKVTTTNRIMTAGDTNEITLPIGNKIMGLLLRAATYPDGSSRNSSMADVRLEVDNVEVMYSRTEWEGLQGEIGRLLPAGWAWLSHRHRSNIASTYTQNEYTLEAVHDIASVQAYAYLDLDPLRDGSYTLNTQGAASVTLNVTSDVTDTIESRILAVELVETGTAGA